MSIKKYSGTSFAEVTSRKRFNGSQWTDLTLGKRFDGSKWVDLWSSTTAPSESVQTYTKTYNLSSAQIYWGSGNKDNQSSSITDLIVGSYGGTSSTNRRTLLFFPLTAIKSDLSGAVISKVELYLCRLSTSHGNSSAYLNVKCAGYSSAPSTWDGSDSGAADSGTPSFTRGEGKWITLLNSVATGIRDGSIKCLALDADSNYNLSAYGRYVRSGTALRITYKK